MRRSTSALTAGTLGAALMASVVSAQQYQSPAGGQGNGPAASGSASASMRAPASSDASAATDAPGAGSVSNPIVGMAATRGARYLLRNGLDYLSYQEYECALKFLREAETRQKELGETERLQLKQGIERAQRGLREAVGSQRPYALSSRSRPGGFAVARPETRIATAKSQPPDEARTASTSSRVPSREGDDQGQPIQLTGAEVAAATPAVATAMPGADHAAAPAAAASAGPAPASTDQPAALPEIPTLPASPAPSNTTVEEHSSSEPSQASSAQNAPTTPGSPEVPVAPPLETGPQSSGAEESGAVPARAPRAPSESAAPSQALDRPAPAGPAPATPGPAPDVVDPKLSPSKDSEATLASNAPAS